MSTPLPKDDVKLDNLLKATMEMAITQRNHRQTRGNGDQDPFIEWCIALGKLYQEASLREDPKVTMRKLKQLLKEKPV